MAEHPAIEVARFPLDAIAGMRDAYRREMACQIVHDSWHARGFATSYLLRARGEVVGYGAVGGAPRDVPDVVKEFFVLPPRRGDALPLFRAMVAASGARRIEAQTNDVLLMRMLHDCATDLSSATILLADVVTTTLDPPAPGAVVRPLDEADRARVFAHTVEPVGEWGLDVGGEIVATGGIATHYNPPYGDVYMEVASAHRRRGFGSYLVQELKRICREAGRVPAARCHRDNGASLRTLQRAGLLPCARIVHGRLALGRDAVGGRQGDV
jgi:GNAT superfamily N-acetyltransferase